MHRPHPAWQRYRRAPALDARHRQTDRGHDFPASIGQRKIYPLVWADIAHDRSSISPNDTLACLQKCPERPMDWPIRTSLLTLSLTFTTFIGGIFRMLVRAEIE